MSMNLHIASIVALLSAALAAEARAQGPKPMEEIHLIHHSHTDLGFTDLPSTTVRQHMDFIRQALDFADATADYPEDARFRWTCESALMVENFLHAAANEQRTRFAKAVERGQIEVAAMPDNIVGLYDAAEWEATARRLAPLWKAYRARVAMQNDINGFPWGLLPRLREQGIETVWMGCNEDTSLPLTSTPDAWWWEGPDGKRTLVWSGTHYCFGFSLFHAEEWRRGPVPSATEVWYNPPSPGETWQTSKENLDAAEQILHAKLAAMKYKHPVVAFQVTNMWRMDNDPPSRQIADFVKAWNAAGKKPHLVMSTPSRFLARLHETSGDLITTVRRGDWQDWWSDGIATTPELLIANQQAKRILGDLPRAARMLGAPDVPGASNAAWSDAILFDEHTWGSYNSISQPYHPRTLGGIAEKAVLAYRAEEQAKLARTKMLRGAKDYCDFSRTRFLRVLNPGTTIRSGWVILPATAIRFAANAARDVATGRIYPLQDLRGPEWSNPDLENAPYDRPNDVWAWHVTQRRFFVANLGPEEIRNFELVEAVPPTAAQSNGLRVSWDEAGGRIASLISADGREWIDSAAPHALGQAIVESLKDRGQRPLLAARDRQQLEKQFRDDPAKLVTARRETTPYAESLLTAWEHPLLYRIEQRWDVLKDIPRAELTTTIWTKEIADPMAVYLAFPFKLPRADLVYSSIGHETVFGRDQIPGTCAEALCQNSGLIFRSSDAAILLATPDTPLGCAGIPALRRRILAPYSPADARYYVNVLNNYWHTNFSIVKANKLVLHHWIEPTAAGQASTTMLSDELWSYPIAPPSKHSERAPGS